MCHTVFGPLRYGPGDYLVLPIGTTWRPDRDPGSAQRLLYLEAPSEIEPPQRHRNDNGQLLEHSPYSQRDLHAPDDVPRGPTRASSRSMSVRRIGSAPATTANTRSTSWAGTATCGHSGSTSPIPSRSPGRVHQPPVQETFQAKQLRRLLVRAPQVRIATRCRSRHRNNHSNINSDEVIFYVAGNFMSRRGVDIASFTLHPAGIPHGPHSGTVEASVGREGTEELAVMVDTFHPVHLTKAAPELDGDRYSYSWLPSEDHEKEPPSSRTATPRHSRTDSRDVSSAGMAPRTDARGDIDDQDETRATAGRLESGRDIDLAGRDLLVLGRMAAAGGDSGAARALLSGAVGSGDAAAAGEASNLMGSADAIADAIVPRLRSRRRRAEAEPT